MKHTSISCLDLDPFLKDEEFCNSYIMCPDEIYKEYKEKNNSEVNSWTQWSRKQQDWFGKEYVKILGLGSYM